MVLFSEQAKHLDEVNTNMSKVQLTLDDSRRLTGKNLLWDQPGAIIDAYVESVDKLELVHVWQAYVSQLFARVGWQAQQTCYRIFDNGVNLAISAPMDALYAAVELNDLAWRMVELHYGLTPTPFEHDIEPLKNTAELAEQQHESFDLELKIRQLTDAIAQESNAELMTLIAKAEAQNAPYLVDDDEFSLGFGGSAKIWPIGALPAIDSLNWSQFKRVPCVYVTGTNGKSTTVRLISKMFSKANYCCGVTSTDFIKVGERVIDTGDYSGPSGARMLLREPELEAAVLEVARGGLLRRGLPIAQVDAAIITNVAEDHLGQYGINDLAGLAQTKFMVAKGLNQDKPLVLNADDDTILTHYKTHQADLPKRICWFSLEENHPTLVQHRQQGGATCFVRNAHLVYQDSRQSNDHQNYNHQSNELIAIDEIPMTLAGAAKHNVRNALGAIAIAKSLDLPESAIISALKEFKSDASDNPGRGNFYSVNGATVIVDFAHNVHSMEAMASTLNAMPAKRKFLMLGHAGDRSNAEITALTQSILAINPDFLMITETPEYLRGRALGEIPEIIANTALQQGLTQAQLGYSDSPTAGAIEVIKRISEGDLVFLMVLSQRQDIDAILNQQTH